MPVRPAAPSTRGGFWQAAVRIASTVSAAWIVIFITPRFHLPLKLALETTLVVLLASITAILLLRALREGGQHHRSSRS